MKYSWVTSCSENAFPLKANAGLTALGFSSAPASPWRPSQITRADEMAHLVLRIPQCELGCNKRLLICLSSSLDCEPLEGRDPAWVFCVHLVPWVGLASEMFISWNWNCTVGSHLFSEPKSVFVVCFQANRGELNCSRWSEDHWGQWADGYSWRYWCQHLPAEALPGDDGCWWLLPRDQSSAGGRDHNDQWVVPLAATSLSNPQHHEQHQALCSGYTVCRRLKFYNQWGRCCYDHWESKAQRDKLLKFSQLGSGCVSIAAVIMMHSTMFPNFENHVAMETMEE